MEPDYAENMMYSPNFHCPEVSDTISLYIRAPFHFANRVKDSGRAWVYCVCVFRYRGWLVRRVCCLLFVWGCEVHPSPAGDRRHRVHGSERCGLLEHSSLIRWHATWRESRERCIWGLRGTPVRLPLRLNSNFSLLW